LVQAFAARLVFQQQHAGPEQVNKPIGLGLGTGQLFNGVLKRRLAFAGDAKNLEEVDPERLGQAVFVDGVFSGAAKTQRARFDFVPAHMHGDALLGIGQLVWGVSPATL